MPTEHNSDDQEDGFEKQFCFEEEFVTPLSDRDRDIFLAMLDDPPPANEAFRRAAAKYKMRVDRRSD